MTHVSPVISGRASQVVLNVYMAIFFLYMFLPLIIMVAAGFNDFEQPSVTIWRGFTFKWFGVLARDSRMWVGLANSIIIASAVIAISLPLGLAGAFLVTRLESRYNGLIYAVMVSPLLTPGIILGISTLVFWREIGVSGGLFTAAAAQATFISSYAMLMFMARLQRQDISLEEAALDLGATHARAFRRITVPFLRPTILTAAVIAFLQSDPDRRRDCLPAVFRELQHHNFLDRRRSYLGDRNRRADAFRPQPRHQRDRDSFHHRDDHLRDGLCGAART
jgi:spermidine/putrescine transport system permease protein